MNKTTLLCTIHDLRFEQLDDWHERGLPAPECYLCMAEEVKAAKQEAAEAKRQRDVLLEAIEIKRSVQVAPGKELTK